MYLQNRTHQDMCARDVTYGTISTTLWELTLTKLDLYKLRNMGDNSITTYTDLLPKYRISKAF
jgi:hypothetical protein